MTDNDRLINSLYTMLFFEESRLKNDVDTSFYILKQTSDDMYLLERYRQNLQRYEDFKIFQRKVIEVLKCF
jgi:hypothetical protein